MSQPTHEARLPWITIAPKPYQQLAGLSALLGRSSLGMPLIELIQLRISQINGCAFCVDMHARELRKGGETWQRINSVVTWREVTLYSARERAALDWAELLTRLPDGHAGQDASFEALKLQFSDQEIVELNWAIAAINAWNRMAVGMRAPVVEQAIE
ncbi:carboxymuconolactone decarboxylase family protein [Pelomonas sp. KK5]|uniref:carboxymuconolactone decarboxylase family protein n=1 Tax=Pelomonas sp. KK5 TaxID=1855730 RepID=UPI00097C8DD6|nr:carboxymuconolactone decarboxylase family protein [Pelomonas sp. KK5]